MNCLLKSVLLVVTPLSVTAAPVVSLAGPQPRSLGVSHSQSLRSANSGQLSRAPQFNRSISLNSFSPANASGMQRRVTTPGQLQGNAVGHLPQFVPNGRLIQNRTNPVTTQINRNVIRKIDPRVITATSGDQKLNAVGQAHAPAGVTKLAGKLGTDAQSLVKNLAKKDKILKLKKNFLVKQKNISLGDLPKLQEAQKHALKCLSLNPKCAWWINCYYHCYWHTCHCWCWDYWYPCHFYVIHCHAGYSYYFGAELYAIPGIGLGVAAVTPGSPADRAGLVASDMIVSANGQPLQTLDSNEVMKYAIQTSGGVLNMEVLKETSDQAVLMAAFLQKVYHYSH